MKGTYLVQYFPPEQASGLHLVEDLLEGFAKHGWTINLYTPTPTRGITAEQRNEYKKKRTEKKYKGKLTIHRMHLYREGTGIISRALRYILFSIECFWKSVTVPSDFIFTGSGPPTQGVVVGLAKKICRNKIIIYNLQDIFPDSLVTSGICSKDSMLMRVGHIMENFTYKNADVIITISDDMKANVVAKGVAPEKVKVVRNWIDINRVNPVDRLDNKLFDDLGLSRDAFYVVYAGNLGKAQGVDVIISTAELLNSQNDIHFVIFGNGSEEMNIKNQAEHLQNLSIFSLQPMHRVSEVYSLGDVSIIPCKPGTGSAGMPSKTWTIMATGTAIVGSFDTGGELDKTLREAECGYCVEAGNAEKLAEAIKNLRDNPNEVARLGQNARKFAEKKGSKEQAVAQYIKIIEDTVK